MSQDQYSDGLAEGFDMGERDSKERILELESRIKTLEAQLEAARWDIDGVVGVICENTAIHVQPLKHKSEVVLHGNEHDLAEAIITHQQKRIEEAGK